MKKQQKLAKRYGRLTVLGEVVDESNGRRVAQVKCRCGVVKEVLVDSLLAGRTKSCGRGPCKNYVRAVYEPGYVPPAPRACNRATVQRAWNFYHHANPAKRLNMEQLAARYCVNVHTLTSIFRSVRRAGGIDKYIKALEKHHDNSSS